MPPNFFFVRKEVDQTLGCIPSLNRAFTGGNLKDFHNKLLLDPKSVNALQKSDLQGEIPSDLQYLLGDFEIEILKSSIEIHAKVKKLIKLLVAVHEAVEDNTRSTEEFLKNINLSKYAEALSDYDTVEDFTDSTTAEELATELENLLQEKGPRPQRRKLVREVEKCRGKKDGIPELVDEMRETLRDILAFSEKMAGDFSQIKKKIRTAIDTINKNKRKYQSDKNYYSWAKLICVGLCVVAVAVTAGATVCVAIGVKTAVTGATAAGAAGTAAGVAGAGGTTAAAAGTCITTAGTAVAGVTVTGEAVAVVAVKGATGAGMTAAGAMGAGAYLSHKKTMELSDYVDELTGMEKAMGTIHGHVMEREVDWINDVLGPAKQADVNQGAVAERVVKLPSASPDNQKFREETKASLENLVMFSKNMTNLKDTANSVLSYLHG